MRECVCGHLQNEHNGGPDYAAGSTGCLVDGCDCEEFEDAVLLDDEETIP